MLSKIFLLTLFCVSLTQVRGVNVEYDIRRALDRLQDRSRAAEDRLDLGFRNTNAKLDMLKTKAGIFVEKEAKLEETIRRNVDRTAEIMREKAYEDRKPEATFTCIDKAEKQTMGKIEEYGPKFQVDVRRMERTKTAVMETAMKPLDTIQNSLEEVYERAETEIKNSKTPYSVRQALTKALRAYDLLLTEIRRVEEQVGTALNQFMRDVSNLYQNYSRQMERIQSEGLGAIRRCMYARDIFGQNQVL